MTEHAKNRVSQPRRPRAAQRAAAVLLFACASCASVEFNRETATSGTFEATGWSLTLLSHDFPMRALDIARANVSDARQPNVVVTEAEVGPDLWIFDWILDIVGVRRAKVVGTWGWPQDEPTIEDATLQSTLGF